MTTSKLSKIEIPKNWTPFDLLKDWIDEYKKYANGAPVVFNLATASKNNAIKNRFVALQEIAADGIIFNTNSNSPKVYHINENPNVAASFLLYHCKDKSSSVSRQVRIEGIAEKLPSSMNNEFFQHLPLNAKIRSLLIKEQSVEVDWNDLKNRHDDLLYKVQNGEVPLKNAPNNLIIFKIIPKMFDFYYSQNDEIADRILFKKCDGETWTYSHITA